MPITPAPTSYEFLLRSGARFHVICEAPPQPQWQTYGTVFGDPIPALVWDIAGSRSYDAYGDAEYPATTLDWQLMPGTNEAFIRGLTYIPVDSVYSVRAVESNITPLVGVPTFLTFSVWLKSNAMRYDVAINTRMVHEPLSVIGPWQFASSRATTPRQQKQEVILYAVSPIDTLPQEENPAPLPAYLPGAKPNLSFSTTDWQNVLNDLAIYKSDILAIHPRAHL